MGLNELLSRYAVRRAHVLVVEVPGWWSLRVALERQVLGRGWALAESPADTDVLVVCGEPGAELGELVDRVWDQLPGPRVRLDLPDLEALDGALDAVAEQLADAASHREDARQRSAAPDDGDMDHGDMDMDHGDMDHGDMDHGDMDMGMGDMAPHGIPLAGGGEDRDGLEMDVLHLPLGPVLRHWPAGLVLRCALQGDVVVEAQASVLDSGHDAAHAPAVPAEAVACDHVSALLSLAGWPDGGASARRVRDALLDGAPREATRPALERVRREVVRSRVLRWSLRGVGEIGAKTIAAHHLPESLAGDAHDRLVRMLDRALDGAPREPGPEPAPLVGALPDLVAGLELAAVRLLVASLALDPVPSHEQAARG